MINSLVDVEALLAPIPGKNPAGEDLRYSGLYDAIREARRADEVFVQGDWKSELKVADWSRVIWLATEALATKTKDLQISAWLSEALVKQHGFTGLRDSLRLTRGLLEQFWDNLYPEIDEEDLEARANSLAWMARQVALAMKEVSVTKSTKGQDYSYNDYQDSIQLQVPENSHLNDTHEIQRINRIERDAAGERKITSGHWHAAEETTSRTFYEETHSLLSECWEEFQMLSREMDKRFNDQAPELSTLGRSLDSVRLLVEKSLKEKRELEAVPAVVSVAPQSKIKDACVAASDTSSSIHFTAHYPAELTPTEWSTLLVYAYVSGARGAVQLDSQSRLGLRAKGHRKSHATATRFIGSGAEITVVPEMPGCRFNPPQASFLWLEDLHCIEFRLQASPELLGFEQGMATNCRIAFYVGPILVGEIKFGALFTSKDDESRYPLPYRDVTTDLYQAIFISYSQEDNNVVEQLEKAYTVLGFESLRDLKILRSGEKWNQALLKRIEEADIFQLCWSSAAKQSEYVEREWQHALELNRNSFIRPVYWEIPMPEPPPELMGIHFARLDFI